MRKVLYSIKKFIVKHPFLIIFIGFIIMQDELSPSEGFILVSICFLVAVYSQRIQKTYDEVTNDLSFNQWKIYKLYCSKLVELGVKYEETSQKEEALRYREITDHIINNGKAELFIPSKTLIDLKITLGKIGLDYKKNEENRDSAVGRYINKLKHCSGNIKDDWLTFDEPEEIIDYSDWKIYQYTFNELSESISDSKKLQL